LADENDGVADRFLAAHPEFRPLSVEALLDKQGVKLATGERLHLLPHRHDTDGFFAVVMERSADA
jgi:16S rRNA (cytosine967-C5)-methyltransferase